jgi:hypothetical protein
MISIVEQHLQPTKKGTSSMESYQAVETLVLFMPGHEF